MKYLGIGLLVIVGFVILGAIGTATKIITIPWLKLNSQVQMERDIITETYNAENALYNYHWFKEKSEYIKALESQIVNAEASFKSYVEFVGDRKDWTFEDKTEYARLNSVVLGLKNSYEQSVGEYNARASSVDRAVFKNELPLFFNLKAF